MRAGVAATAVPDDYFNSLYKLKLDPFGSWIVYSRFAFKV